ncbi:hypothetical protein Tco_0656198 [Tanacetum coccineum]|uniref:Uncharacterized protein n=1 Tax=Tanacetum coccineum TaxID=301880 RepID=A0ABQ4X844_9ASTR
MCAIDGAGFDWSDMAEEEIQANMALMAFSDSEVKNDKSCSKTCLKNYEDLKKQYYDLLVKLDDTDFKAATYKRGLSILEGQVVKYKEHEVLFSEEIDLLKRSVGHKAYQNRLLRTELEKVKLEKEGFEFKIAKFEKSAKDLDHLLASLEEFKELEVNEHGPRNSSLIPTTGCDKESSSLKLTKLGKKSFSSTANLVRIGMSDMRMEVDPPNSKVHEVIIKKDSKIVKGKREQSISLVLKAKKESSNEEILTFRSKDEEYAMAVRDFKKFFQKTRFGDPNHLIGECPKPPRNKNQNDFVGGSLSDMGEEEEKNTKDETYLITQESNKICLGSDLEPNEWIKDNGYTKHVTSNQKLFSTYKAYN